MARKIRYSRSTRKQFAAASAQAASAGTTEGQMSRPLTVVNGVLTQSAKRILLSIGGLSVEILISDAVPQTARTALDTRAGAFGTRGGVDGVA